MGLTQYVPPVYGTVFRSIAKFLHSTREQSMPEQSMKTKTCKLLGILIWLPFLLPAKTLADVYPWPFEMPKFVWSLPGTYVLGYDTLQDAISAAEQPTRSGSSPECAFELFIYDNGKWATWAAIDPPPGVQCLIGEIQAYCPSKLAKWGWTNYHPFWAPPDGGWLCALDDWDNRLAKEAGPPTVCVGDPCDPSIGNSFQVEVDYVGAGALPLKFERFYNSLIPSTSGLGAHWRSSYDKRIARQGENYVSLAYPNGRTVAFRNTGRWTSDPDVTDVLEQLPNGWRVSSGELTELYDTTGRLLSISDRAGLVLQLNYDTTGLLSEVRDPFGRTLNFTYDQQRRLTGVRDPSNQSIQFAYSADNFNNLLSATYPGGVQRSYHYGMVTRSRAGPMTLQGW
jgi:YD repeat-containing protein